MLNAVWATLFCSGLVAGFLRGNTAAVTTAILASTSTAVETLLGIAGAICFWSGLMHVAQESGLSANLAALVRPIMRPLFPGLRRNSAAYEYVALNLSANLLGVGSASTPLGLKAMEEMAREDGSGQASDSMCTLVIFNTVGPSLIPTTVVALRASLGSKSPDAVVGPALLAALMAVAVALASDRLFRRKRRRTR